MKHIVSRVLPVAVIGGALLVLVSCKGDEGKADAGADFSLAEAGNLDLPPRPDLKPDGSGEPAPVIKEIIPNNGFASGNVPVLLLGENFKAGVAVYVDGQPLSSSVSVASAISMTFTMPPNPYDTAPYTKSGKVQVGIMIEGQFSNQVDFYYTVSVPMTASFKGSVTTAASESFRDFPSDPILGKAVAAAPDAGAAPTIKAEVGLGPEGSDPSKTATWKWFEARFTKKDGIYDLYSGALTAPLSITYDVAYRFSQDGGKSWIYADTDEGDLKYDPAEAAKLVAVNAPLGYCLANEHCLVHSPKVTCKLNPTDKTKHRCVECLIDPDCTGFAGAFGPKCEKSQNLCYCTADPECAANPNGAICVPGGNYCGCQGHNNCVAPAQCSQDPDTNMTTCK